MLTLTVSNLTLIHEALTIAEAQLRNADKGDINGPCYLRSLRMAALAQTIEALPVTATKASA